MTIKKELSFEASMAELESILVTLSGPEVSLDASIELYARAAGLIADCNKRLADAQVKIEEIDARLAKDDI